MEPKAATLAERGFSAAASARLLRKRKADVLDNREFRTQSKLRRRRAGSAKVPSAYAKLTLETVGHWRLASAVCQFVVS